MALADLAVRALRARNVDDVLRDGCNVLRALLAFDTVRVFRYDAERRVFIGGPGTMEWDHPGVEIPDVPTRIHGAVRERGEPFVYSDVASEDRIDVRLLQARNLRSGIVALIGSHDEPYGVIAAHCHHRRDYDEGDVAVVRTVASIAAAAIARYAVETDLRETRALYAAVANTAQEGIVTTDVDGILTFVNARMAAMLGGEPADLLGRDILDMVVDDDKPIALRRREARRQGQATRYDVRLRGLDGRVIWTSIAGNPLSDESGAVIGAVGIISDVTQRVEAAELLQKQKAQLATAQMLAHIGSWEVDLESRTVSWSDEMYRIVGLEPQSRPITVDYMCTLVPTSEAGSVTPICRAIRQGEGVDLVHELRRADGRIRWVHSIGRLTTDAVTGRGRYIATTLDITEQKNAEDAREKLSSRVLEAAVEWKETFDSIDAPIVILDAEQRISRLNTAALKLSRFTTHRQAIGVGAAEAGEHPLWDALLTLRQECVEQGQVISRRVSMRDGRTWELLASPWREADRQRATLVASDVTAHARMEEHLRRSERLSAIGALVAGVVHEIRNPLFGISATLDAMDAIGCECAAASFGGALRQQVTRLKELTRDLLEYGRPVPPEFRQVDLEPVLDKARTSVMPLAEEACVAIDIRMHGPLPMLRIDSRRLLQVFENLLRNAIQHSPRGSIVDVHAAVEDGAVRISVADRGSGIADEDLPHIFEPFFTRSRGGTGLGLSLVQRIVEEHDGLIEAAARNGGGAVLTVRLPLDRNTP